METQRKSSASHYSNIEGVTHRIILYWDEKKGVSIFDPNQGREGVKVYSAENLKSWNEVWIVIPENVEVDDE